MTRKSNSAADESASSSGGGRSAIKRTSQAADKRSATTKTARYTSHRSRTPQSTQPEVVSSSSAAASGSSPANSSMAGPSSSASTMASPGPSRSSQGTRQPKTPSPSKRRARYSFHTMDNTWPADVKIEKGVAGNEERSADGGTGLAASSQFRSKPPTAPAASADANDQSAPHAKGHFPVFHPLSILNIWEQHEHNANLDIQAEVLDRLGEDVAFKQFELINHLKTFARHSGGRIGPTLLNEVLRHSDVAFLLGHPDTNEPHHWNSITTPPAPNTTATGAQCHFFPPDRICDLRDEYLRAEPLSPAAALRSASFAVVARRSERPLVRLDETLSLCALAKDRKMREYAVHLAARSPWIAKRFDDLLLFVAEILLFKYSRSEMRAACALLAALTRNPCVRAVQGSSDVLWWHLVQLLVCAVLGRSYGSQNAAKARRQRPVKTEAGCPVKAEPVDAADAADAMDYDALPAEIKLEGEAQFAQQQMDDQSQAIVIDSAGLMQKIEFSGCYGPDGDGGLAIADIAELVGASPDAIGPSTLVTLVIKPEGEEMEVQLEPVEDCGVEVAPVEMQDALFAEPEEVKRDAHGEEEEEQQQQQQQPQQLWLKEEPQEGQFQYTGDFFLPPQSVENGGEQAHLPQAEEQGQQPEEDARELAKERLRGDDERHSQLWTEKCGDDQLEELLRVIGLSAACWGFVETEMTFVLRKRMEVAFAGALQFNDFGWLTRLMQLLWTLGDFAFRELIPYLELIDPQQIPEQSTVHFNACGIFLRGKSDIFLHEYLHEVCGDSLLPFMCYHARFSQKFIAHRHRKWLRNRQQALCMSIERPVRHYRGPKPPPSPSKPPTFAALFPEASPSPIQPQRSPQAIRIAIDMSARTSGKPAEPHRKCPPANLASRPSAVVSTASTQLKMYIVHKHRRIRSYRQPKFRQFGTFDYVHLQF